MEIRTVVEKVVLLAVMALFFLSSLVKLVPTFFPVDVGNHMRKEFVRCSKVCLTTMFGYQPDPVTYMTVTGILEFCGFLALLFRDTRQYGCVILGIVMIGATHTHLCLYEYDRTTLPVLVFLAACFIYKSTGNVKAKTD